MSQVSESKSSACECCNRQVMLQFHHLIPRKVHRRAYFKNNFSKQELNHGIYICKQCHRGIHRTYDEMRLAKEFNSLDSIKNDDALAKHFSWVAKQKEQGSRKSSR